MGRALRPRLGTRKYWKKNQEFETKGLKEKKKESKDWDFQGKEGWQKVSCNPYVYTTVEELHVEISKIVHSKQRCRKY